MRRHWIASGLVHVAFAAALVVAVRSPSFDTREAERPPIGVSLQGGQRQQPVARRAQTQPRQAAVGVETTTAAAEPAPAVGAGPVGDPDGREATARERYLYGLRARIEERKVYPGVSRRLRETGEVLVRFDVLRDGRIQGIQIARPSPFARLNEAAVAAVTDLERYQALPTEILGDKLTVEVPISYVLR